MAVVDGADVDTPPDYRSQGEQFALGALSPPVVEKQGKFVVSLVYELAVRLVEYLVGAASHVAIKLAEIVMRAEDRNAAAFQGLTRAAIKDLTGADAGSGNAAIGRTLMNSLAGGAGSQSGAALEPSTAGAEAYMEMVMQLALEGYVEGGITSALSAGFLDKFTELDDILASVLGLGRMSRAVMRPLMTAKVITPFQWHVNKQYRPELLSPASAIRQFLRGRWTAEQLQEELARQGWSADRIDALVNEQRKYFSAGDVRTLVEREHWTYDQGIQHLREQGYDQAAAVDLLRLEGLRRIDQLEASEGAAIVSAYASRAIDEADFHRLMSTAVKNPRERALLEELGTIRRAVNVPRLSPSRVRQLVVNGIASVSDFRRALEREGYPPDDVAFEELDLRAELADRRDLEKAKAEQLAARDADKAAAAAEKERREAALAERQALPTLQEFRRAYVRGLITRDAFAAALEREKIAISGEDLALLLADADVDRGKYLEAVERQAAAAAAKPNPVLPLAAYEQSVITGVLSLEQYARELVARGYDETEQSVLTELLADRLDQRREARAARDAAIARAEERAAAAEAKAAAAEQRAQDRAAIAGASLPAFERAVRLGVRTRADYAAFLDQVETSEVGKALILDLLDAQLEEDAAARAKREAADEAATAHTLTLSQRRRAVLVGVRPRAYYEQALRDAGYPAADQLVELALLDVELEQQADANARRAAIAAAHETARLAKAAADAARAEAAGAPPPAPTLSLGQIERAVKLGLLPPDALRGELAAKGYDDADSELLVAMVVGQVPDTRAAEQRWTEIAAEFDGKGIGLADLERAVKAGFRTLDDYDAELAARGYGPDDQLLLRQLLEDEIALEQLRLRTATAARLKKLDDAPPLEEIEAAVNAGEVTAAQLRDVLVRFGLDPTTALLYARMVFTFGTEA